MDDSFKWSKFCKNKKKKKIKKAETEQSSRNQAEVKKYEKLSEINARIDELADKLAEMISNKEPGNVYGDILSSALIDLYGANMTKHELNAKILSDPSIVNGLIDTICRQKVEVERSVAKLEEEGNEMYNALYELNNIEKELNSKEEIRKIVEEIGKASSINEKIKVYVMYSLKKYGSQRIPMKNANERRCNDPLSESVWRPTSGMGVIESVLRMVSIIDAEQTEESADGTQGKEMQRKSIEKSIESKKEMLKPESTIAKKIMSGYMDRAFRMWASMYWLCIEQDYIQRFMKCHDECMRVIGEKEVKQGNEGWMSEQLQKEMSVIVKGVYRSDALKKLAMMKHVVDGVSKSSMPRVMRMNINASENVRKTRILNVLHGIHKRINSIHDNGDSEEWSGEKRVRTYIEDEVSNKIEEIRNLVVYKRFNDDKNNKSIYARIDELIDGMDGLKSVMQIASNLLDNMSTGQECMNELRMGLEKIDMVQIERSIVSDVLDLVNANYEFMGSVLNKAFDFTVSMMNRLPVSKNNKEWNDFRSVISRILSVISDDGQGEKHKNAQDSAEKHELKQDSAEKHELKQDSAEEHELKQESAEKHELKIDLDMFMSKVNEAVNISGVIEKLEKIFNEVCVYMIPHSKDNNHLIDKVITYKNELNKVANMVINQYYVPWIIDRQVKHLKGRLDSMKNVDSCKPFINDDIWRMEGSMKAHNMASEYAKMCGKQNESICSQKQRMECMDRLKIILYELAVQYFKKNCYENGWQQPPVISHADIAENNTRYQIITHSQGCKQIQTQRSDNVCEINNCMVATAVITTLLVCMMAIVLSTCILYIWGARISKAVMRSMYVVCLIASVTTGIYMMYRVYVECDEEYDKDGGSMSGMKRNAKYWKGEAWSEEVRMATMIVCTVIMIPEIMANNMMMDGESVKVEDVMTVAMTIAVIVAGMYVAENGVPEAATYKSVCSGVTVNDAMMMTGMFAMMTMRMMCVGEWIYGWNGRVVSVIAVGIAMCMAVNVILYMKIEEYRALTQRVVLRSDERLHEGVLKSGVVCAMVLLSTLPSMIDRMRSTRTNELTG